MKQMIIIFLAIGLIYLGMNEAYGVTTDGRFTDWNNKPYLVDPDGDGSNIDDLVKVSWFPDAAANKLYFKLTRSSSNRSNRSWNAYIDLKADGNVFYVNINSNPNSGKVKVTLYNQSGVFLWSTTGYWCDGYNSEIYIPLSDITLVSEAGYSLEAYVSTDSDKAPNSGPIIISTISTYPFVTLLAALMIVVVVSLKRKKGVIYDSFSSVMDYCTRLTKQIRS